MKNWKQLSISDFIVEKTELDEHCFAEVEFNKQKIDINLPHRHFVNERVVKFCKEALAEWTENLNKNTFVAEKHVQRFLPGRKLKPSELLMWDVELFEPDGNPKPVQDGTPSGIEFMFNVDGDYSDPNYDLSQFCETTVLSLAFNVKDYVIDWEKPYLHMTNDFA